MTERKLSDESAGIRGIVFDAVGTLIEPRPSVAEVYASAASRQSVRLEPALLRQRFRLHFNDLESAESENPFVTNELNERRRWRRIVEGCLPEIPDRDRAFEELWTHFGTPASWNVFPDAAHAIEGLRRDGIRLGIASNFDRRLREVLLGWRLFDGWSEAAVVSSDVGYRKPHPSFYLAVAQRMRLEPREILFVGDDVENDYKAPLRAGFQAVLVDRHAKLGPEVRSISNLVGLCGPWSCNDR